MNTIYDGIISALALIISPTPELMTIVALTFKVSGVAILLATLGGLPLGAMLALKRFPMRGVIISTLNAFMGLPPVVVGLVLYIILSRSGPLGFMGLLYSPTAMIIAQLVLALPIVAALTVSAVAGVEHNIALAARTLGATPMQQSVAVVREARYGIFAAIMAALGRAMAEVGAILIVGGNILGYTRVMTTTIAMETDKGDFTLALALGIILLVISLCLNFGLYAMQRRAA